MSKILLAISFLFLIGFNTNAQENTKKWAQQTQFRLGYYHLGSYSKENPSFFLEHQMNYKISDHWRLGVGAGINLYPSALAYPLYLDGQYHFSLGKLPAHFSQSYGVNLKLGELSFFSHRYVGNFNLLLFPKKKIQLMTGLGYLYVWDNHGGKNVSFLLNIGIQY